MKILELMTANFRITIPQLAKATGITRKGVEWQLAQLKKDGTLKRVGPRNGGHWAVGQ